MKSLWTKSILAGLLYGGLVILAFPPVGWWMLAIAIPAPMFWIARTLGTRAGRIWPWALLAGLSSYPAWMYLQWFMIDNAGPAAPLAWWYLTWWPSLFVWLAARVRQRWGKSEWWMIAATVLWTGIEFFRGEIWFGGYPWYLAGQPLIGNFAAVGIARIAGYYAWMPAIMLFPLSALLLMSLVNQRPTRSVKDVVMLGVGVGLWLIPLALGFWVQVQGQSEPETRGVLRVAAVQTNTPQSTKLAWSRQRQFEDFERFRELTRQAAGDANKPDLILWPETMFPGLGLDPGTLAGMRAYATSQGWEGDSTNVFASTLVKDQLELGVPMLVGAIAHDGFRIESDAQGKPSARFDAKHNSAVMIRDGKIEPERYNKMALCPFGEFIPLAWRWPNIQNALVGFGAAGMEFDLSFGTQPHVFTVATSGGPARVVAPICFETSYASTCRELVYGPEGRRADVMVNLSNDGWFGAQKGLRETFLLICRWRCAELGVPMVRSVNTGISAIIDARGNVLKSGVDGRDERWNIDGVLAGDVALPGPGAGTLYGRTGNWVGWLMLVLGAGLGVWTWVPGRAGVGEQG